MKSLTGTQSGKEEDLRTLCLEHTKMKLTKEQRRKDAGIRWRREGKDYVFYGLTCEVEIDTTNVLCAGMLGCPINLRSVASRLGNAVYNPSQMSCLTIRNRKIGRGKCAAVIFRTGYMSVNGSATVEEARTNFRQFARILHRMGYEIDISKIQIQCISAVARLPANLKPNMKHAMKRLGASYEPELHNSASIKRSGVCLLLFPTGAMVITGLKLGRGHRRVVHRLIKSIVYNSKMS